LKRFLNVLMDVTPSDVKKVCTSATCASGLLASASAFLKPFATHVSWRSRSVNAFAARGTPLLEKSIVMTRGRARGRGRGGRREREAEGVRRARGE
jgi:hypothetical protein